MSALWSFDISLTRSMKSFRIMNHFKCLAYANLSILSGSTDIHSITSLWLVFIKQCLLALQQDVTLRVPWQTHSCCQTNGKSWCWCAHPGMLHIPPQLSKHHILPGLPGLVYHHLNNLCLSSSVPSERHWSLHRMIGEHPLSTDACKIFYHSVIMRGTIYQKNASNAQCNLCNILYIQISKLYLFIHSKAFSTVLRSEGQPYNGH